MERQPLWITTPHLLSRPGALVPAQSQFSWEERKHHVNTARAQARKPGGCWEARHLLPLPPIRFWPDWARGPGGVHIQDRAMPSPLSQAALTGEQKKLGPAKLFPVTSRPGDASGKMPRFGRALNTRPCKEPQPWEPGTGRPRSNHPYLLLRKVYQPPWRIYPVLCPLPSATPAGVPTMRAAGARRGGGTEMTQNHTRPHLLNPAGLRHSPPATLGWRFRLDTEMEVEGAASCPPPSD